MITYPKIETLFERDEKGHVDTMRLRCREFALIHHWLVTEKIDGTNIRVALVPPLLSADDENPRELLGWRVRLEGRTDKAQIPKPLLMYLQGTFTAEKMLGLCKPKKDGQLEYYPITLYGEGYGAGIQKGGGNYREGVSLRLIDVLVDGKWWLDWTNVCGIAESLGIKTVPAVPLTVLVDNYGHKWSERIEPLGRVEDIVELVQHGFASRVASEDGGASCQAEGIVARTDPYLYNKHGQPLRFKLKTKDFAREES